MADAEVKKAFDLFRVHGEANAKGMSGKNFVKICKDAGIVNKSCTTTDIDITFNKKKTKGERMINFQTFLGCLDELSEKSTGGDKKKIRNLVANATPGAKGVTKTSKTGGVDKFTDSSKYTGSHKERFGADGKGKGIDGRVERAENSGYVGNYKGEGSYDEKVSK